MPTVHLDCGTYFGHLWVKNRKMSDSPGVGVLDVLSSQSSTCVVTNGNTKGLGWNASPQKPNTITIAI